MALKDEIKWMRVFIEGVVIVGSILLAFGIQAWWDGWQDRDFEQEALGRLQVEFTENRGRLPELGTRARVAPRVSALLGAGTFDRVTPVLDGLLRSGRYELIRDPQLRAAVPNRERRLAQLIEREQLARTFVDTRLRPTLATHGDMSRIFLRSGARDVLAGSDEITVLRVDDELKALVSEKLARDEDLLRLAAELRARDR